ncbi:hypothetical protein OFR41_12190 [Brachyspira hyodysenteriae]|nr:hypothetical protein [Brachyspira hyodysenteriae]MDA0049953.1 hypothetical protein [Brachyspira hyodysenteriae]
MFYDRVQYGEETFSIKVLPLPDKKVLKIFQEELEILFLLQE